MTDEEQKELPEHLAEALVRGRLHKDLSSWGRLRRHFFAGLLVVTPLGLTLWIVAWLVNLVDGNARHFLASVLKRFGLDYQFVLFGHEYAVVPFGFGILVVFVGICFVGMVASNFLGRRLLHILDRIIRRVPGVSWIYSSATQISHALLNRKKNLFQGVAIVQYPRKGMYGIGFITARSVAHPSGAGEGTCAAVFIPTTPNPTSGFLLLVPERDLFETPMSVEEGMKMVISGGVIVPPAISTTAPRSALSTHEPRAAEG